MNKTLYSAPIRQIANIYQQFKDDKEIVPFSLSGELLPSP